MIQGYSEHSAAERTFLAWVRTGIAVIAFGFVVEKFNVFLQSMADLALADAGRRAQLAHVPGRLGQYDGLVMILGGVALVVLATVRFVRTTRRLDDPGTHSASSVRAELILSGWLVLIVTSYTVYLAFG
jgi:putative membrane protein